MQEDKRLNIFLGINLYEKLRKFAFKKKTSKSKVIRIALEKLFTEEK